jgi:hypothetical protein
VVAPATTTAPDAAEEDDQVQKWRRERNGG